MNNNFKEFVIPPIVLICICLVMTAVLAVTYQFTKPLIEASRIAKAEASRAAVMPAADEFQLYTGDLDEGVSEVYYALADGEVIGCVVTSQSRGYGGDYVVMSGYDANGAITGVVVSSHSETPGLGSKTAADSFTSRFVGKDADTYASVDAITGVTVSSNAMKNALGLAFAAQETAMMEVAE